MQILYSQHRFAQANCGYTNSYVALHACIIIKLLILIDASRILYLLRGGIEPMSDKNNCAEAYNQSHNITTETSITIHLTLYRKSVFFQREKTLMICRAFFYATSLRIYDKSLRICTDSTWISSRPAWMLVLNILNLQASFMICEFRFVLSGA